MSLSFQNDLHVLHPPYVDRWSLFWYQIFIRVFVKRGVLRRSSKGSGASPAWISMKTPHRRVQQQELSSSRARYKAFYVSIVTSVPIGV
jgi:hypothetical protein